MHFLNIDKEFFLDVSQIAVAMKDSSDNLIIILKNSSAPITLSLNKEATERIINSVTIWNQSLIQNQENNK